MCRCVDVMGVMDYGLLGDSHFDVFYFLWLHVCVCVCLYVCLCNWHTLGFLGDDRLLCFCQSLVCCFFFVKMLLQQ